MNRRTENSFRLSLDRRGLIISALVGVTVGLISAWVMWEAPPPLVITADSAPLAPPSGPVTGPAPARSKPAIDGQSNLLNRTRLPVEELDVRQARLEDGRLVLNLGQDRKVTLTLIPAIQKRAKQIFEKAQVPYGALVAMDPKTGRLLGYYEHSTANPNIKNLAGLANPPAASIFKVITTAALLETTRITAETSVCYNGGGLRGISKRHLVDDPRRDVRCRTLTEALATSTNAIFGKLTYRHLNAGVLRHYAHAFGWDREIPFIFPVEQSRSYFSDDRVELARTSAGFYNTQLSPLHGALVAGAIANGGRMMRPSLIEHYSVDGKTVMEHTTVPMGRVCRQNTAETLAKMMVMTTESGTAAPYFRKRSRALKGIDVAAKTGSLSANADDGTRHRFSWWIGFAPAEHPRIALAALVVNVGKWRIKSNYLAREVLESYFHTIMKKEVAQR
jgi:cell division protein FtsI/penicillin-binding protein 2